MWLFIALYSVVGFFIFLDVAVDTKLTIDIKTSSVVKLTCLSLLLGVGAALLWIFFYFDCCDGAGRLFQRKDGVTIKRHIINWVEK